MSQTLLFTQQNQAENRMRLLYELTAALSQAVTREQVAQVIVQKGLTALGAHLGSVALINENRKTYQMLDTKGLPREILTQPHYSLLETVSPLTDAMRTGDSIFINTQDEYLRRYPNLTEIIQKSSGSQATVSLPLIVNGQIIGGMGMSFDHPVAMDADIKEFMVALAHQCAQALERARLYELEAWARQRLTYLAEAGAVLNSSLNYETTLRNVTGLIVPALADWCVVDMVEGDDYRRVATAHTNPAQIEFLSALLQEYPPDLDNPYGFKAVIRSQKSQIIPEIPEAIFEQIARDARHLELIRQLRLKSNMCVPLILHGQAIGAITFAYSESDRRYGMEDLKFAELLAQRIALAVENARVYEQEQKARIDAEKANHLKLQFLGMVSHELRTPLTSIKGFASTLLAEDVEWDAETQHQYLTIIDHESDKLTGLVEQLLEVSRMQAGTLAIKAEPTTLYHILDLCEPQIKVTTAGHDFMLEVEENLPGIVADRQRIAQVIVNLVDNAAKYSPPGSRILLTAKRAAAVIQVEVSDLGEGIPEGERQQVFEAFRQLERKAGKRPGAGLGLAICKGLIEAHHGRIWIETNYPGGTVIKFTLPSVYGE